MITQVAVFQMAWQKCTNLVTKSEFLLSREKEQGLLSFTYWKLKENFRMP